MADDEVTQAAAADEPQPTTELDPSETASAGQLAYSDHTSSVPVIDYQPPSRTGWILALVLAAAGALAAAMFMLGRSTAPGTAPIAAAPSSSSTAPAPVAAPPVPTSAAAPPPAPPTIVVPPSGPTTSVPPLATPQARIAEPMICSWHYQYPEMQPVDLALSLTDRGIYNSYDEARLVVDLVLADGCHGI
ncbi:hypothetical protein A5715_21275 [Mycolicibacter heraklionensis]|nr:hypothetical protein A5715_21275 [Mycolicibacter heraklionensis]